jgi:hypothetical protein
MSEVIAIDTGQDIVGIYSAAERKYTAYRGARIAEAIERIKHAAVVVTYNGNHADLTDLGRWAGLGKDVPLSINGEHVDMREVCWSNEIWGSSLHNTYLKHFSNLPKFTDTHEGCNQLDTELTLALYHLWKQGQLRVVGGHET